jgi:hypothetical protein
MKVYIITECCECDDMTCSGRWVDSVFLDKSKAEEKVKNCDWLRIDEYETTD